jgi:hypothetical protein
MIEANVFSTTTAGNYVVYAKKNDTIISNEITFFAKEYIAPEIPIVITASTDTIVADGIDEITFNVTEGKSVITNEIDIYVNGNKINGSSFSTTTPGSYNVYAKKNDVISNEITITAEAAADGKTIVFADGVTLTSGWYDVNKIGNGQQNGDINMCWAASCANIIQWWQDRYVEAGNTLPAGAVTGPGTTYQLALMEMYHELWDNSRGGTTSHGITWYFEGRNIMKEAAAGSHAQPLSNNTGGYYSSIWESQILPHVYHDYDYVVVPGIVEYDNLISTEYNNYYLWGNGSGLSDEQRLRKFTELVVEFMDRGVVSLAVSLGSNLGTLHHATTLWGYEIDNATGLLTRIWITDSDDMTTEPKEPVLHEYAVSVHETHHTIKFSGAPYGACYAVALYPVSGYGSR